MKRVSSRDVDSPRKLLANRGTLTLVGDLRQRVSGRGHFDDWPELAVPGLRRVAFAVNYRQSQPVGEFVRAAHARLYGHPPTWRTPDRGGAGPRPRVRRIASARHLVAAVADEATRWRTLIPAGTVAVLYQGKWAGAAKLRDAVEDRLQRTLTCVHLAKGSGKGDALQQTDCVVIATVAGTKGLEFDAVVTIDPAGVWAADPAVMSTPRRNGFYVAASRARHGLSVVVGPACRWVDAPALAALADAVGH